MAMVILSVGRGSAFHAVSNGYPGHTLGTEKLYSLEVEVTGRRRDLGSGKGVAGKLIGQLRWRGFAKIEMAVVILGLSSDTKTASLDGREDDAYELAETGRVENHNPIIRAPRRVHVVDPAARNRVLALHAGRVEPTENRRGQRPGAILLGFVKFTHHSMA